MRPLDVRLVRAAFPGRLIVDFDRVGSTMTEAAELAAEGCPSGTLVVAEEQIAGQGRHGHSWLSEAGSGLYLSIVLRMPTETPVITLALGLATVEAIARIAEVRCDLRWPNDVMLSGRKAAGILVQVADRAIIAGIGINVNHAEFPNELQAEATSLRLETGSLIGREDLLICLLRSVDSFAKMLAEGGNAPIIRLFTQASSYAEGKRVTVETGGGQIEGVTAGLDENGFLRVRRDDGSLELVLAGGVRPV